MLNKQCGSCKEIKPLSDFHKRKKGKDGRQSYCKICDAKATSKYLKSEKGKLYMKQWGSSEAGFNSYRKYLEGKGKQKHVQYARQQREKYPDKCKARTHINNAIRRGDIKRPDSCERCGIIPKLAVDGRSSIQAHHADHSRPFIVEWLCIDCHRQADKEVANVA